MSTIILRDQIGTNANDVDTMIFEPCDLIGGGGEMSTWSIYFPELYMGIKNFHFRYEN